MGATQLNLTYPQNIVNQTVHGYDLVSGKVTDITSPNVSWPGAAGGMPANTRDMVRWVRALFSSKVVDGYQLQELQSLVCLIWLKLFISPIFIWQIYYKYVCEGGFTLRVNCLFFTSL